ASKGIAATANADASRAAAEILKKGGDAVDGAVAAALALGVVQPDSSGLGGGGFALVWSAKDKKARVLDFRETAPAKATKDMFVVDGKVDPKLSRWGGLAVAVPGRPAWPSWKRRTASSGSPPSRSPRSSWRVAATRSRIISSARSTCAAPAA